MPNKLDKYYTKREVAKKCVAFLQEHNILLNSCVEPSAGDGSFLNFLPQDTIAYDIAPEREDIKQKDFFSVSSLPASCLVIGNPPFGKRSDTAIRFFNHAAALGAEIIAFILPVSFMKWGVQKLLDERYNLLDYFFLEENSFLNCGKDFNVRCVFQIWTKLPCKNLRILKAPPTKHPDFELWQYNATPAAKSYVYQPWEYAVFRQGYKDYHHLFTKEDFDKVEDIIQNTNIQMFLMKPNTEEAKKFIQQADFENLAMRNTTTPGFGKADFISYYLEWKEHLNEPTT